MFVITERDESNKPLRDKRGHGGYVNDKMVKALAATIELALDDQGHYLDSCDFVADYGEEWPEAAKQKAEDWHATGTLAGMFGLDGLRQGCWDMSDRFGAYVKPQEWAKNDKLDWQDTEI
jgi:hypothetical protein